VALVFVLVALSSGCAGAEPTESLVRPDGSPVGVPVPLVYERVPADQEGASGWELSRPGGVAGRTKPYGHIVHRQLAPEAVDQLARRTLRLVSEQGVDPLAVSQSQPGSMTVIDYTEIDEDDWWGARIRFVATQSEGQLVVDRLVLIGRGRGDVVEVQFACDARCFMTYGKEIDHIVSSWTTKDEP
jgi:hypothetical protein